MTTFLFKRTLATRMKTPARLLITLNTCCWIIVAGKRPRSLNRADHAGMSGKGFLASGKGN